MQYLSTWTAVLCPRPTATRSTLLSNLLSPKGKRDTKATEGCRHAHLDCIVWLQCMGIRVCRDEQYLVKVPVKII